MTTPVTMNTQQSPQQFIVVTSPPQAKQTVYQNFNGRRSRGLGITQIVLGILILLTSGVGFFVHEAIRGNGQVNMFLVGFGFWGPIFFLTSGSLGVVAAKQKTRKKLNALLGTSITSCILSTAVFSSSAFLIAATVGNDELEDEDEVYVIGVIAIGSFQLAAGLVEFITSVWLSKLCGDHICKTEKRPQTVQYMTTTNSDGTVSQQVLMSQVHQQSVVPPAGSVSATGAATASVTSYPDSMMVIQPHGCITTNAETFSKMQLKDGYQNAGYHPYPIQPAYGVAQPYPVQLQPAYGVAQPYPVQPQPAYGAAQPYPASMEPGLHSPSSHPSEIETVRTVPPANDNTGPPPAYDAAVGEQMPSTEDTDNQNITAL